MMLIIVICCVTWYTNCFTYYIIIVVVACASAILGVAVLRQCLHCFSSYDLRPITNILQWRLLLGVVYRE